MANSSQAAEANADGKENMHLSLGAVTHCGGDSELLTPEVCREIRELKCVHAGGKGRSP